MGFGPVEITPSVMSGLTADQVNGAEDSTFNGAGLSVAILLHEKTQFKISGKIAYKNIKYDNWKFGVDNLELRAEDESSSNINASVNLMKNLNLALNYDQTLEKSNLSGDTSENYRQEVVSTALKLNF
jgi:hypothetical protein